MRLIDLTDHPPFGKLTVIERAGSAKSGHAQWLCQCECGNVVTVSSNPLLRGLTNSCGCLHNELLAERNSTHGMSKTSEYMAWAHMKNRCYNLKDKKFKDYGGRGITVCNRWLKFENFFADMGKRPSSGHSIDRIENSGNYEPGNCRWATAAEQSRNTRRNTNITNSVTGETLCAAEWSRRLGGSIHLVRMRLNTYGWDEQRAITTPA